MCLRMHSLFIFVFLITSSYCVDKSNFKTCNDSGFCRRHRAKTTKLTDYVLITDSEVIEKTKVTVTVQHVPSNVLFLFEITRIRGSGFRQRFFEQKPVRKRYEIPAGDALVEGLEEAPIEVKRTPLTDNEGKKVPGLEITSEDGVEKVLVYSSPFRVDFLLAGKTLVTMNRRGLLRFEATRERPENATSPPGEFGDGEGEETFKAHRDSKPHGPTSVGVDIRFEGCEHVYGVPEHADSLALKSTEANGLDPYRLYNLDVFEYELNNPMALYGSVPFMLGHSGNHTAGIFWHNPSETWIDVASSKAAGGTLSKLWSLVGSGSSASNSESLVDTHWFSESGVIDLFVLLGHNPLSVFKQYAKLTGTTPLPPLFGIAYHQCRWNYNDETDLLQVESKFDEFDIPLDVVWLDIEHTDSKKYFTWDSSKFPDPAGMVAKLHSRGRKLVTVIDPHIKRDDGWQLYNNARSSNHFIKAAGSSSDYEGWCWPGSSAWPDFLAPAVRRWWAELFLTHPASRPDNTFTWNDMNEPSVFNGPEVTMHKDAVHALSGGWEHREVHNVYGLHVHRASWEGQLLRSENAHRPFVLTRAFFAGSQRYGAVWTGDNKAGWDHLQASLSMLLSLSIAGITLCGADVGGFFGNPDPELLTRWYQAAAFQPFFRAHAHLDTKRREPWLMPEENRQLIRQAVRTRYSLLPFWYTLFYESSKSGAPVMSPMWVHFPKDTGTFDMDDQYMLGTSILIKPVTSAGATSQEIYLPGAEGGRPSEIWYYQDGWQGYKGGQKVSVPVTMETIPYFIRGGSIIPKRERVRRSSALCRHDPYTLVIALDLSDYAEGRLYRDDELSLRHGSTHKEFAFYQVTFAHNRLSLALLHDAPGGPKQQAHAVPPSFVERVVVLGLKQRPLALEAHDGPQESGKGRPVEFFYSESARVLVGRKPGLALDATKVWTMRFRYAHDEL